MKKLVVFIATFFIFFCASWAQAQTVEIIRDTANISIQKKNKKINFVLYKTTLPKVTAKMMATIWAHDINQEFSFSPDWYVFLEGGIILVHPQKHGLVVIHTNGMNNTVDFVNLDMLGLQKLAQHIVNQYVRVGETVYAPLVLTKGYRLKKKKNNQQDVGYIYSRYK